MTTSEQLLSQAHGEAARLLGERFGDVRLGPLALIKDTTRTVVGRAAVLGGPPGIASVVVKVIRDDLATGCTEWASLAFLSARPTLRGVVPAWLGGARASPPMFIMEDLGQGRALDAVLAGGDAREVGRVIRLLASQMARLQGATLGAEGEFLAIRSALPAAEQLGRLHEADRWLAQTARLTGWLAAIDSPAPPDLERCLAHIAAIYREPGPWLCFSHGDPAPSNTHIVGDELRLLDFEYGGFRHALYDLSAWAVLCPLPERQLQQMCETFQRTLANDLPVARASEAFRDGWGALCAYRAIALLSWVSPAVLESDRPFVGAWSARQALLAALARAEAAAAPVAALHPAALALRRLYEKLQQRWPELGAAGSVPTPWPALEGVSATSGIAAVPETLR